MLRYSLAKSVQRPKGTRVLLAPVQPGLGAEKQYRAELRRMLAKIAKETRESVIPRYEADRAAERARLAFTADGAEGSWFAALRALINRLTGASSQMVRNILNLEAKRHTSGFMAAAKKALGIDLAAVVRDEDLDEYLQAAVDRNVSLITGLGDDIRQRIERVVYDNSVAGNSVATLKKQLAEQFGIADRRAQLIARDQIGKFNSDLNRIRQTQAGVTSYIWVTSHDERVRDRHRRLDGNEYKWGEATGAEEGLPPGQPIRCRCVARGVVEF